jgi:hypothetical protein
VIKMDEQKLNQFLNEQSLINMSVIEQLNKQAEYLESIIERINIIYEALNIQGGEGIPEVNVNMNRRSINFNPSKARGVYLEGTSPDEIEAKLNKHKEEEELVEAEREVEVTQAIANVDHNETNHIQENVIDEIVMNQAIQFGDRIRVITKTMDDTGVFIELNDRYLVWVIDGGRITFTDLTGATVMKLT